MQKPKRIAFDKAKVAQSGRDILAMAETEPERLAHIYKRMSSLLKRELDTWSSRHPWYDLIFFVYILRCILNSISKAFMMTDVLVVGVFMQY